MASLSYTTARAGGRVGSRLKLGWKAKSRRATKYLLFGVEPKNGKPPVQTTLVRLSGFFEQFFPLLQAINQKLPPEKRIRVAIR